MRRRIDIAVTLALVLAWLGLLLYPTASDFWNQLHQSSGVEAYRERLRTLDDEGRRALWDEAVRYNEQLLALYQGSEPEGMPAYEDVLNVTEDGTMGLVIIPKIDVRAVIRHGTDEGMLLNHIGHLPSSSLPVGGEGTHCVVVGHRGLPSAVLFTDLDQMEVGDLFFLETLGERMAYEVDQIVTVLPHELDELVVEPGRDLCTMVTCTPYGVNSHRLLVRGHRTELPVDEETGEAYVPEGTGRPHPVFKTLAGAAGIGALLVLFSRTKRRRRKRKGRAEA